jgi:hypothetical protein
MKNKSQRNINNNPSNFTPLIVIIVVLLLIIAFMLGRTNKPDYSSEKLATPTSVINIRPTSTSTPKPQFDVQGCINRALASGTSCLNNCHNEAINRGNQCPKNNLTIQQNCLNQAQLLSTGCSTDCSSTAKINMNNCRIGINN